jgi:hypothetical protein
MKNVLYIHGMGGGADSRIPSILKEVFASKCLSEINVICRTYDFDPETASMQIESWVRELSPSLIIGESLGSLHALRIKGIPHLFVSPALNASFHFQIFAILSLIPGISSVLDRIYRPREGDRQGLHFTFSVLRKYRLHRKLALDNAVSMGSEDFFYAFFGTADHYRKSGVVSLRTWKKYFGNTYTVYEGTHFMEEEYVRGVLTEKIAEVLNISL